MSESISVDRSDLQRLVDLAVEYIEKVEEEWGSGYSFARLVELKDEDALIVERVRAPMHLEPEEDQ